MRRTEYLITELRNSTDNKDTNGIKDAEIISYLNYAQKLLQNIIFKVNPKADIFTKSATFAYSSTGEYELPADIFAENAVESVEYKVGQEYCPIDRIAPTQSSSGYYTKGTKLVVKGFLNLDIRVNYFKELPRMDKRWGKIQTVNSGVSLVLEVGFDSTASTVDDYISVIDKYGSQARGSIYVDSYTGGTWETSDNLTGVSVGDYVCMGANSVNASELPDACETYLLDYARQRIFTRNNYDDANKQVYFTDSQKADISALFANNQKDVLEPPITDWDSLDF